MKHLVLASLLIAAVPAAGADGARFGLPWDWSHRHLLHNPDTAAEARAKGTYETWERSFRDPRFAFAALRKMERAQAKSGGGAQSAAKASAAVEGIIERYYVVILGRASDPGGKAYHASEVDRLQAQQVDPREALRVISKNFFLSPEYVGRHRTDAQFVDDLYEAYLGRAPDSDGLAFWLGQAAGGVTREGMMLAFMFSDEFQVYMNGALGQSTQRPETALVTDAYRSSLSRLPESDGLNYWREFVREGQCKGGVAEKAHDLMVNFVQSPEYVGRNRSSRDYVTDLYDAIFRRAPDLGGLDFWAGRIDSGSMTRVQVMEAFLTSEEWALIISLLGEAGCSSVTGVPRDWSNFMGGGAGVGVKGTFPAKYAFDASAAPSCTNDFVVFTTAAAGASGGGAQATRLSNNVSGPLTAGGGALGGLVRVTNGARVLTLTLGATNTGLTFSDAGTNNDRAANIAAAINRNGGTVGVTATSVGARVQVTAISGGGGGNSIALAEGLNSFSWGGGGGTLGGGGGAAGQPTIFALNQLYKTTCDDAADPPVRPLPSTMWAYNTGTGNFAETSPILSLDGTQVAFMERSGATVSLVLLKWSSTVSVGTLGAPTTPTLAASGAAYRACAAPCMFKISTGQNNTRSSPFYDYLNDVLYVGSANGTLRKFTGVFLGTPAAAGAPWPVTVSTGNALSSPVYDEYTGLVFVGSALAAGGSGGQLHTVNAAGTVVSSGTLAGFVGGTPGTGVAEAPIVDANAQRVYTFVGSDNSSLCLGGNDPCQAVYQFPTNTSIAGLTSPVQRIGRGGQVARTLKSGAFDNNYWTSSVTSPTGFLYVCGALGDASDTDRPTLWRIPITANVMGAAVVGPGLTNPAGPDSEECSPITEVLGGTGVDYLFVGVPNASIHGCGGGGCMFMFDITNIAPGAWAGTTPVASLQAPGGTGGIIIDNISATPGAAQIYYSTLTSPGNAVQASQAGLN